MEILEKLFGSTVKVKIMRLFLFSPDQVFETTEIVRKSKSTPTIVRRELGVLEKMHMIKRRSARGSRGSAWALNPTFPYLHQLQNLLINISPVNHLEVVKRLGRAGRVKALILSGVFIQYWESRIDMMIVGDNLKKSTIDNIVKNLESEIGKELNYTVLDTVDFKYRIGVQDRLVRDMLDYPHEVVLDRLGVL
ncbi:MAG: hypothetical protein PHF79_03995 [Candidatus Pacebacteria bacterium]|nr:hypothetical protein [Candidatus Paceibacterota bacterium]